MSKFKILLSILVAAILGFTSTASALTTQTVAAGAGVTITGASLNIDFTRANAWTGLQTFANATTTLLSAGKLWLTGITGSTQCLHVDTNGLVSGTGSDCGTGSGGVTNLAATYPLLTSGATGSVTISTALSTTTLRQTYGSAQGGDLSIATSSDTNILLNVSNTAGAFTFTPAWIGTLADSRITSASTWNAKVGTISIVSANGFAGSSSGGTTPALTLTTSITGVLKGNGTAISAAANGTDFTLVASSTCAAGSGLQGIKADGSTYCFTPAGSTYTGTYPIVVSGSVISTALSSSTLTASSPLTGSFAQVGTGGSLGIQAASASQNGYLSSGDYSLIHTATTTFSSPLVYTLATNAVTCQVASGSQPGCLASADWTTFNSKQAALTFTYPLVNTTNTVTLGFGTTTNNTWAATQTFTNGMVLTGTSSPGAVQGQLTYDTGNESLTFMNNDSAISLQIGQEEWTRVWNGTGSTITNGSAVYTSGTHGTLPSVSLSDASASDKIVTMGLATEDILNGATGTVTTLGVVHGLNTLAFTAGANVYVSAVTPGTLTTVAPVSPNYRYRVGVVTVSSATVGAIQVTPTTAAVGNGTAGQFLGINASAKQAFLGFSYPLLSAGTGVSLAYGTTTANSWSALQSFSNASSTQLSVFTKAYFGATATSTFSSAGVLNLAGLGTPAGTFLAADPSGNVIATTSPSGGSSLTGSTGQIAYFSGTNTAAGTSTIFINTASLVGIGTTTFSNAFTVQGFDGTTVATNGTIGGSFFLLSGNAGAATGGGFTSVGGPITIQTGKGSTAASSPGGAGGAINIVSGQGGGSSGDDAGAGGAINIKTGIAGGSGTNPLPGDIILTTGATEVARARNGFFGIGITAPTTKLYVQSADNVVNTTLLANVTSANCTAADTFIDFRTTGGSIGNVVCTAVAGTIAYNTFTGSHFTRIDDMSHVVAASLLLSTGEDVIGGEITLSKSELSCERASQRVYGVYGGTQKDENQMVLSIGTGLMWVANKGQDIQTGDILMSSDVCGAAEVQKRKTFFGSEIKDGTISNISAGKAMQNVRWLKGEKTRLIRVIYLGG